LVAGLAAQKLGNAFDAADLAHDTYVRIMVSGNTPLPDQSRRHLTQIANGLVIDLYRRRQIEAAYLDAISLMPAPEVPSEEARALVIEALIELDTMLHGLPAKSPYGAVAVQTGWIKLSRDCRTPARLGVVSGEIRRCRAVGLLSGLV